MELDIQSAIMYYKELLVIPVRSYKLENAMGHLENFIEAQLKEIKPCQPKLTTKTTNDEIPF